MRILQRHFAMLDSGVTGEMDHPGWRHPGRWHPNECRNIFAAEFRIALDKRSPLRVVTVICRTVAKKVASCFEEISSPGVSEATDAGLGNSW